MDWQTKEWLEAQIDEQNEKLDAIMQHLDISLDQEYDEEDDNEDNPEEEILPEI